MPRHPIAVLRALDGSATRAEILRFTTRWALRTAVDRGDVLRLARGVYALPILPEPFAVAAAVRGVLSHTSAANFWGFDGLLRPDAVHVTVGRNRRPAPREGVVLHYADVRDQGATAPVRTVLDCARTLPFREGLAIADSALRSGRIRAGALRRSAESLRGAGRARAVRVAEHADGRAANPFESATRAILIEAGLTGFVPQVQIGKHRVDLAHPGLRIVVEADSWEHHGSRSALTRDCARYNELTVGDELVLRFAWEHVMLRPDWVRETVKAAVALRQTARRTRRSRQDAAQSA
jgi:very-short-patch-repair endonuclease